MKGLILLGEPQCWDFEHPGVNASLIGTALLAYPGSRILFLAEESHIGRVRELLETEVHPEGPPLAWKSILIPPRRARTFRRLGREWSALRRILTTAAREGASVIIITSASELGFFFLKILLAFSTRRVPVVAVLHGVLATLVPGAPRKRWGALRGMRLVFRLPHPTQLSYLAFGPSILRSLAEIQPTAARHTIAIELPCSWSVHSMPSLPRARPEPVCFGYFGVSGGRGKGFDRFVRLAEEIRARRTGADFTMVGHLSSQEDRIRFGPLFPNAPATPLSHAAYGERAAQLTYAVSITDPEVYRIVASTAFLDALSFVKPGIYLRNLYIEECFRQMGDIGFLCDSVDEIRECMIAILDEFPVARYASQCGTIFRMRRLFEPAVIAPSFRAAIEQRQTRYA